MSQPVNDAAPLNFAELVERCVGRLDLVQRILDKFQAQFAGDLDQLEAALEQADLAGVSRLAHRLKGSAANVAAPRLRATAEGIEKRAAGGDVDALADCCWTLREEWSRFRQAVAAHGETTSTRS